jgi:hypothetical protein
MYSIYLSASPNNPRAGDSVELTVSSNLFNLDSSKITWYVDGVARKETSNQNITIKTKNTGDKTIIKVVVEGSDGVTKETSIEIFPAGVDLVVEPMSYSLPFYKGKPFFAAQGIVKIVAVPDIMINGEKILSKDLIFRWSTGDTILGANSGKGKDSILLNGTIPIRDINISVEIRDTSGAVIVQSSKTIFVSNPKILFFENSPLYGILYNRAINISYYLGTREELNVIAKPFSFDFSSDTSNDANYIWYVNGNYIAPNGKINEMLFRQATENLKSTASVSLELTNNRKIFQSATDNFNVEFGQ